MPHLDIDECLYDLILIDGLCVSCHKVVQTIHRRDTKGCFRFASQQSPLGQRLIEKYGLRHAENQSIIYLAQGTVYTYSAAVLEIYAQLPGVIRGFSFLRIVPRPIRDFFYTLYARNRYRLFGRLDTCTIPDASLRSKFLDF